jgi:hypothetical protein
MCAMMGILLVNEFYYPNDSVYPIFLEKSGHLPIHILHFGDHPEKVVAV